MHKQCLCVICGGQSPEHEVSLESTRNVLAAIDRRRFAIQLIGIDKRGNWNRYNPDRFVLDRTGRRGRVRTALANPGPRVTLACVNGRGCDCPID